MDENFVLSPFTRFINVSTIGLNKNIVEKLIKNNLKLTNHLRLLSNEDLEKQFGFDKNEIKEINEKVKSLDVGFKPIPVLKLNDDILVIKSGSKSFDWAFGFNGLPTCRMTQIFGEAGVGKSQICFQLCLRVQLNKSDGGLNSEALYFDTENSFRPERIYEMAENYYRSQNVIQEDLLRIKAEEILKRIHIRNINTNADDLYDLIVNGRLESFLDSNSNIRLFILDSVAYHFRYDYEHDDFTRTRQLAKIGKKLKQIAIERNMAILITNQVKLSNEPALGVLWNSICSTSLYLSRFYQNENVSERKCSVFKSPSVPFGYSFKYLINERGIVDHDSYE